MSLSTSNHRLSGQSCPACLLALVVVVCCANLAPAQVPDLPGWDLVWNDEFDGTSLNTTNWTALDRRDSFNNEKQYYHPNQVTIAGGNLQLTAIDVPLQGKAYQSGLITSNNLFGPGRFEARIDLPTTQGMWPAFWLNANHVSWPQGGEIDILENRGSQPELVSSAYHWQTDPGPCCDQHQFVYDEYTAPGQPVDFHSGFHTYAAEWDETTIRYYVDDNLHFTVTENANRPIFETAKNIIVNLAVGGNFGGDPDGSTVFPQTMLVDYVRYWQRTTEPEPEGNLLSNSGFDSNGGSLAGWDDFGNSIGNVAASADLANDGTTHALKIYGQFNGGSNNSGASQGAAITGGETLRAIASTHTPSWDTLFGKSNEVSMKVEFYSTFGATYGSGAFLGETIQVVHDGSSPENIWLNHELEVTAPANAVEARLSFVLNQPSLDDGAIWIDSTGLFIEGLDGDFDSNGIVDGLDFLAWQSDPSVGSLAEWEANYNTSGSAATAAAVPEPASGTLALAVVCLALGRRRR